MPGFNAVGAHAVGSIFAGAVNIIPERWTEPFNSINAKRSLTRAVVATTVLAFTPFVTAPPETITVDKWFHDLSVPVKFPLRLATGLQQTTAFVNATPSIDSLESNWHQPWSIPVRFPPDLRAPRQQAFFAEPTGMTVPETVMYSKFAYPWSEPVRFLPRLRTGLHQTLAFQPAPSPFVASGWFNWLTEPVRFKPQLRTGLQQTTVLNALPRVSFGWEQRLSEPVKFPPRLRPGLNLFNSLPSPTLPQPSLLLEGWYNWLSEPVRFPQGLKDYLQQTTAMPPRLLPTPTITGTMAATEQGDIFTAGGTTFNQISSADVGIIEIFPRAAFGGIIETQQVSANVGQVVNPTAQQSGTTVTPSTAANVSIRVI